MRYYGGLFCVHLTADMGFDVIGGGWVGTGLLGAVLSWLLLKYLPDQAVERKELMLRFDENERARRTEDRILREAEASRCKEDHRLLAEQLLANTKETIVLAKEIRNISDSWIKAQAAREKA